ncbi:MAG: hypothetical protein DWQ05_18630 [Calditrichaeota bacterium]|nr:MAG: hypothetical protein DWQ05_18630 [Calditrichota bacterium]
MGNQKKINYAILVILLGMIFSSNLFALPQRPQGPPPMPDSTQIAKMVDELAAELSLKKDVKSKISDLYFDHFDEVGTMMKSSKGDRRNQRTKMDALKKKFEKQVKALLTDEQKDKFNEFMKKRRPRPGQQKAKR